MRPTVRQHRSRNFIAAALAVLMVVVVVRGCVASRDRDPLRGFEPGQQVRLTHGGLERTAVLIVPEGVAPAGGWPIVIMLHGAGGSSANVIKGTGWDAKARAEGFVALFPNGTPENPGRPESFLRNPQTWNSGAKSSLASGEKSADARGVDDVAFLAALLDEVSKRVQIDAARVYVAGHSNGAGMAYRFAAEKPELVAAVGVMAGHLFADLPERLPSPVSLLTIAGSDDPFAPLEGGQVKIGKTGRMTRPMIEHPTRWGRALGLSAEPKTLRDDEKLMIKQWATDASLGSAGSPAPGDGPSHEAKPHPTRAGAGPEVKFIVIKGQGHGWPGKKSALPGLLMGPSVDTLDATEEIWSFFNGKHKTGVDAAATKDAGKTTSPETSSAEGTTSPEKR